MMSETRNLPACREPAFNINNVESRHDQYKNVIIQPM